MSEQILALLFAERDRLNRAIEALGGSTGKPGPSAWNAQHTRSRSCCHCKAKAKAECRWPQGYCRSRTEAVGADQGGQSPVAVCKAGQAEGGGKRNYSGLTLLMQAAFGS